ncbi:MAG: hypothetical protein DSM107014_01315 [Gomphosphaeria aponina SAG 52.96 = DSM 107014]|uniref:Uncharacterized protein n=1 Tax=Gomphosphaeria aponina SAG 52.96 = DSM 107014 TaxID=1521640 RepID=A0A941GLX6_9CHRO|nr:hypothetical protein [Gomphosphaeria aponina SAG 52.96 = DSM 107014]
MSKKFCRSLKKSLWYGVQDLAGELLGSRRERDELREGEFWALLSIASVWEMQIKIQVGKLKLNLPLPELITSQRTINQ